MKVRGRKVLLLGYVVAAVLASTLIAVTHAANADEPVTTRIDADWVRRIVLRLPSVTLTAGVPRYLVGQYGAQSRWGLLQGAQIRCTSAGRTYASVNTTMDHPGDSSVRVVAVRWLFTPPTTGTYECAMNGFATTKEPEGKYLTVVGDDRTTLTMSRPITLGGAEWRVPDGSNPRVDLDDPATPVRENVADVMRRNWTVHQDTTRLSVRAGVEISRVSNGGSSPFVARTTLIATRLNANGGACAPAFTQAKTTTFDVHHIKVHHGLDIAVGTVAGCTRTFAIRTLVQYVPSPDPAVKRHAGMVEDGVYSNTIATNN